VLKGKYLDRPEYQNYGQIILDIADKLFDALNAMRELLNELKLTGIGEAYETVLQVSKLFEAATRSLFKEPRIGSAMFAFIVDNIGWQVIARILSKVQPTL